MSAEASIPVGQQQARKRWQTQISGAEFDRKKTRYLTRQAEEFITQQAYCVIAGLDAHNMLCGSLVMSHPGFVQVLNPYTCLVRLHSDNCATLLLHGLYHAHSRQHISRLGLFFIRHPTRERLCVQGEAELLSHSPQAGEAVWVRLHVQQAFFHCAKYIKTSIDGLTSIIPTSSEQEWQLPALLEKKPIVLSDESLHFIARQTVAFLCTVDGEGQCAVNHRGGAPGFLVALPPTSNAPGGTLLLPDYAGNGAFEAVGNIFETAQAAFVLPNYVSQLALCLTGRASVLELSELPDDQAQRCVGAERIIALSVEGITIQQGDWSSTLAYERTQAQEQFARASSSSQEVCAVQAVRTTTT